MDVYHHPGDCPSPAEGSVVTIGAYDGLHLGHRHVIADVRARAEELGARSMVVTFDRHPASLLRPESAPRLLTDADQKMQLLASTGIDAVVVVRFDRERAEESAEDFVEELIAGCLRARQVVVGEDFHFGHGRKGDLELLRTMGARLGFEATGVPLWTPPTDHRTPQVLWEAPVSSTRIRRMLADGDVEDAALLLGRPHQVRGVVEHGDKRGRELGYPTANVAVPDDTALPADGVYAGWYRRPGGQRIATAISLGRRPTFYVEEGLLLLEAHLLDFDGDLYGEVAQVEFVARLRGQTKFDGAEALIAQMGHDVASARRVLAAPPT